MGPWIILRGAIPIDSNIGGFGHRPLSPREVLSLRVLLLFPWFVLASWLFCVLKAVLQMPFPSHVKLALSWGYSTTMASHGTTVGVGGSVHAHLLPRGTVLPLPSR